MQTSSPKNFPSPQYTPARKLLLIDDEETLRLLLSQILRLEGFEVLTASTAAEGFKLLESEDVAVVITDVKLPDANGISLIKTLKEKNPEAEIVVITAYGTVADGVLAMKHGAFDYIIKGDEDDAMVMTIEKAAEKSGLRRQIKDLQHRVISKSAFATLIGKSQAISETIELAKKVASTETTVLLLGETGTGKELFAEAIHAASKRSDRPFIAINCSAIPKDLQESELFGYKRGAFTGATRDKRGLFEAAHTGTLFLDELGDMSLETQAKLLRVLETRTLTPLGDTKSISVDVRLIAATHRDLEEDAKQGRFREDLFYRLSGFTIYLPSLRDREDDIELLATHFTAVYAAKLQKKISGMENDVRLTLRHAAWKGNIRELKNVIERAVILAGGETLTMADLPQSLVHPASADLIHESPAMFSGLTLEAMEKQHIKTMLAEVNGNKTLAAKRLGIGTA
ncbi:MAG: sigma-54-dependent Fis family transcriptional regulator, partial [Rhizobacter sp.]|nr:sigma-54-dependent Fis family transcriptional regulator [Chlorobiales bacterium]